MGLDIVPLKRVYDDRISFSYGGFHEFRKRLAAAVGIDLMEMEGFGGEGRSWPPTETEPLVFLLHHSDCDGELDYEACDAIAYRLREVAEKAFPAVPPSDALIVPEDEWMREKALALADACQKVSKGDYEGLHFS